MRALLVLVLVAIGAAPARADGFAEIVGGLALPIGNDNWTNTVDPSPKLGVRAGAMAGELGGMLAIDWTPESLANDGGSFGIGSTNAAAHRFRAIASAVFRHRVAPRITISARAGAGLDLAHASAELTILGATSSTSDTDLGYGFELGGGAWFDVGGTQLGVELALPIGKHTKRASRSGEITFDYTSIDIDLLLGIRF
jgi:hypothetical protein